MGIGDSLPRRLFIVDDNLLDLFYTSPRDFVPEGKFYADHFISPIKRADASAH